MAISSRISELARRLSRRPPAAADIVKAASAGGGGGGEMARCLTTMDLILFGVGTVCGGNLYMFPNLIAQVAGGAGIVALALTFVISMATGLHYAELATTLPNTSGSVYMYVYFTLGEVMAVIAGWCLLGEYMIASCFGLKGIGNVVDSLAGGVLHEYEKQATDGMGNDRCVLIAGLPPIDFVAALVCILLTVIIASGVEMSLGFVKIMNVITVAVLVFFFSASFWLGTPQHWEDTGFVPYGVNGIVAAIPMSYYAITCFDGLATAGDECKTPNTSIPIAIFVTIIVGGFLATALSVLFITYDIPLAQIPDANGIMEVFGPLGYPYVKYMMGVGAITSLTTGSFGCLFSTTRVAYAIAKDGFLFKYFDKINAKTQTPLRATIFCGAVATPIAAFMDLTILMGFGVLSALVSYVLVVAATLVTRYPDGELHRMLTSTTSATSLPEEKPAGASGHEPVLENNETTTRVETKTKTERFWIRSKFKQLQTLSFSYFKTFLLLIHLGIILCCVLFASWRDDLKRIPYGVMIVFGVAVTCVIFMVGILLSIPRPRLSGPGDLFRSPLIPHISLLTSAINVYFMTLFDGRQWLFYSAWILMGLLIYACCGCYLSCRHRQTPDETTHIITQRQGGEQETKH